ncbi:putative SAM-dependent methyltransferase [Clavulina sp. PMI_390]|nr:putative SAM-dependent methyltransferase [Clavulina sp. PMI_390]
MADTLDIEAIIQSTYHTGLLPQIANSQTHQRVDILRRFDVVRGARVLEIGCGQGDFTVVLAAAVGNEGHVTAVDPASLDYGSPQTLGQAQGEISAGPLGSRITWIQEDPIKFLSSLSTSGSPAFDLIVFANSLWYFSSPAQIQSTLTAAAKHSKHIAIAEYSLHASPSLQPAGAALPHMYAAYAQGALEVYKPTSESNIRTVISPRAITSLAEQDGLLKLVKEELMTPAPEVDDARWETSRVASKAFVEEINETLKGDEHQRERNLVLSLRDSMLSAMADLPGGKKDIRMMDVWCATFQSSM